MPNQGFWYASGPLRKHEIKAGSAFSQGDVLALDSNSSLSRLNPYAATTSSIFAVADSDSTNSINGKCVVTEVQPMTRFWSAATVGLTLTKGDESGISFSAAKPGRYWTDGSSTTNAVVIDEGTDTLDQSTYSRVIVVFKYADSELDLA